jgi:hypothetical protein
MGLIHTIKSFGLTIRESATDGSDFSNPDADYRVLFLGEDGLLHVKDSAGTVTDPYSAGGAGESLAQHPPVGSPQIWSASTITAGPAANRAYLWKMTPQVDITVARARWTCTTSAGNMDFGIYNSDLSSLLASTGAFASPGTGARSQAFAAAATVALDAGTIYYAAASFSSTSLRIPMWTPLAAGPGFNLWGREEAAHALPSSIAAVDSWEDVFNVALFWFDV